MFPTAALGPHITMRRAPHLSRMSRIAALLLPLHTASLLPLGTRVALAAPVWVWWPRTSPCSNRCTRDTEQHAPTAALAIPFSMPPSAALAPHITMRPALHTLSTIISFHRHDHIPSRSMYHSLLFLRGPFLDIPTRSSSRHFLHGFFAPRSPPGTLIRRPPLCVNAVYAQLLCCSALLLSSYAQLYSFLVIPLLQPCYSPATAQLQHC